ncbi:AAA family ATPase [Thermosipho affectus]|uniref:AAA family ATPase n=1 Tax=Thermosipho affectus TaxID=660294 RepID=UPI00098184D6|nr:AAA family ATPase [Thermosipho affectus]
MKRLPIGIQSFAKLREDKGFYYVDKTRFIKMLSEETSGYFFLSRPRRFGKSLFLDTLRQAFLGKKELFKGLYLEKNWDWSKKYPVIYISFGAGVHKTEEELRETQDMILRKHAEGYDIKLEEKSIKNRFIELIEKVYKKEKEKVVILVDEYDKPILDNIEEKEIAKEMRESLKNFYSVIKDADEYIKFVFITGVTKFSKASIFSGLNNLNDITLDPTI